LTLPSVYWVMSLIWTFNCGGCGIYSGVAPSRIQSSGRVISFHWIAFGTIVFDRDRFVWRRSVSPFWDWYLCLVAKAKNMAL